MKEKDIPSQSAEMSYLCHNYSIDDNVISQSHTFVSLPLPFSIQYMSKTRVASRVAEHPLHSLSSPFLPLSDQISETEEKARARLPRFACHARKGEGKGRKGRGGLHPTSRCYNGLGSSSVGSPSSQHALLCRSGLVHSATRAALPLCTVCVHTDSSPLDLTGVPFRSVLVNSIPRFLSTLTSIHSCRINVG